MMREVGWQQAVQSRRRRVFTRLLAEVRRDIECECVASVDLHDVVHDEHLDNVRQLRARGRVLE